MLIVEILSISEVFWSAAQIDMKRFLKNRSQMSNEETNKNLFFECKKRISQLEINMMTNEKVSHTNPVLIQMQKSLRKVLSLPTERMSTIKMCINEILSLKDRLDILTKSVREQNFVTRPFDSIIYM